MRKFGMAAIGALASVALTGTAIAGTPAPRECVIEVPPGAIVLVLPAPVSMPAPPVQATLPPMPAEQMVDVGFPFPPMPSPGTIIRDVNAMMASTRAHVRSRLRDFAGSGERGVRRVHHVAFEPKRDLHAGGHLHGRQQPGGREGQLHRQCLHARRRPDLDTRDSPAGTHDAAPDRGIAHRGEAPAEFAQLVH